MTTVKIIEGLTILQKYRTDKSGYHIGAEHDVLYAFATDKPVKQPDLDRLIEELGWFQENVEHGDEDFSSKHYQPEESWCAYV